MSISRSDEDSSMDEEGEAAIVIVNSEDETVDSETGSDQSIPSRFLEDSANSPVALAAHEEIVSREDERTLEHPDLGIIDDVAAIVDVVSDGYSHQVQSLRTEAAASSLANSSMSDFRPTKRAKLSSASEDSDEEAENCPICFVPWTNTGTHRLACLKCGHLYGKSCILKWLKMHNGKCPQCNRNARRQDIRVLYARSIKTIDTSERDRAVQELEQEREARKKAEMEAARARLNYQMALAECNQMKQALEQQKQQLEVFRKMSANTLHEPSSSQLHQTCPQNSLQATYAFEKHLKIWEAGGCRVMAYSSIMTTLCVSQPSSSPLFPGFGVKKVLSLDFKSSQYVAIHSKAIRDLSFNTRSPDATLLSCSMDKTIKMTSLITNQITHSYECSAPVWSCAWNLDDRNYFYAGLQNGIVNVFDTRNLSQSVTQLSAEGSCSPVNSLQYLPQTTGSKLRPGGLLVGQLDRSKFYERCSKGDYKLHLLTLEANLTSLSLEENTGHLLATYRPTAKCPNIRHQISELVIEPVNISEESQAMMINCNTIHTFHGGSTQKYLTRNRLMLDPENDHNILACTGDEASQSFQIWHATSGQMQQKIATSDSVLDVCPVIVNDQAFLIALTDKQVSIYKHHPSLV